MKFGLFFLKANNIQSYGCDVRPSLFLHQVAFFICYIIALPGWIVLLVLIFYLPTHQFHLNSNQRQVLKRRECSGSSMKIDIQLPAGKAILISHNQCVFGRLLYLKVEKVTGISKLIQMLFIEDLWYNHMFYYETIGWRMENVLVYLLKCERWRWWWQ